MWPRQNQVHRLPLISLMLTMSHFGGGAGFKIQGAGSITAKAPDQASILDAKAATEGLDDHMSCQGPSKEYKPADEAASRGPEVEFRTDAQGRQ